MNLILRFSENSYVKLLAGLILLVTTAVELIHDVEEGIQAEHGLFIFALIHVLRAFPEIQHAADEIGSSKK